MRTLTDRVVVLTGAASGIGRALALEVARHGAVLALCDVDAEGLEETNESVLSHRVNDVLRVLTAFSVIILPLTLIASIFGMNVHVPGEGSLAAFWVIIAVMVGTLVGMLGYFRHRGWL